MGIVPKVKFASCGPTLELEAVLLLLENWQVLCRLLSTGCLSSWYKDSPAHVALRRYHAGFPWIGCALWYSPPGPPSAADWGCPPVCVWLSLMLTPHLSTWCSQFRRLSLLPPLAAFAFLPSQPGKLSFFPTVQGEVTLLESLYSV